MLKYVQLYSLISTCCWEHCLHLFPSISTTLSYFYPKPASCWGLTMGKYNTYEIFPHWYLKKHQFLTWCGCLYVWSFCVLDGPNFYWVVATSTWYLPWNLDALRSILMTSAGRHSPFSLLCPEQSSNFSWIIWANHSSHNGKHICAWCFLTRGTWKSQLWLDPVIRPISCP